MSRCAKRAEGGMGSLACEQALLADLGEKFGKRKNELLCEADGGGNGESARERKACTETPKRHFYFYCSQATAGPDTKSRFLFVSLDLDKVRVLETKHFLFG